MHQHRRTCITTPGPVGSDGLLVVPPFLLGRSIKCRSWKDDPRNFEATFRPPLNWAVTRGESNRTAPPHPYSPLIARSFSPGTCLGGSDVRPNEPSFLSVGIRFESVKKLVFAGR